DVAADLVDHLLVVDHDDRAGDDHDPERRPPHDDGHRRHDDHVRLRRGRRLRLSASTGPGGGSLAAFAGPRHDTGVARGRCRVDRAVSGTERLRECTLRNRLCASRCSPTAASRTWAGRASTCGTSPRLWSTWVTTSRCWAASPTPSSTPACPWSS